MKSVDEPQIRSSSVAASIWYLTGQTDESEQVRHVAIRSTPFSVGRRSDSSLCLPQTCVSKQHAKIVKHQNEVWISDLESTNGTYVNGEPIKSQTRLQPGDIVQFATVVFRVGRTEHMAEDLADVGTIHEDTCDHALAMVELERLINDRALIPFFQPIVWFDRDSQPVHGYEVLGRSHLIGLSSPSEMFKTASQLDMETELSRVFRSQGFELGQSLDGKFGLFFNTHPEELHGQGLLQSLEELRNDADDRNLVLEIHEAAVTNSGMIQSLRDGLNELGVKLAFDDFGAGQARLLELADVRPDYIKFDMKLIQGIHLAPASRQQVVALLVRMVNELDIIPVAEGVETPEEHTTLHQMGFRMGQGFYYGRPGAISEYSQPVESN